MLRQTQHAAIAEKFFHLCFAAPSAGKIKAATTAYFFPPKAKDK